MKTLLMLAAVAAATPASKPALAPSEIVAAAPASEWVAIEASDLLVMDLASGPESKERRVVIQLMPPPFSQGWVGNIRQLAAARWWDGTSINRVQDNYVVQWGDATEKKVLPTGLETAPASDYETSIHDVSEANAITLEVGADPAQFMKLAEKLHTQANTRGELAMKGSRTSRAPNGWHERDAFSEWVEISNGWPVGISEEKSWPVHCYGMVGVGRGMPPDTGTGAELYTVIGHAPRHLDRNIALVGRVISGIEHLSSLPRGSGPLGFYEKPEERTVITSIRMGTDVKDLPRFEYFSTESSSFATYADARANRRDPFFIQPAGGADICNIPVPVRVASGEPTRK